MAESCSEGDPIDSSSSPLIDSDIYDHISKEAERINRIEEQKTRREEFIANRNISLLRFFREIGLCHDGVYIPKLNEMVAILIKFNSAHPDHTVSLSACWKDTICIMNDLIRIPSYQEWFFKRD